MLHYDKLTVNMPNGAKVKGLKAAWGLSTLRRKLRVVSNNDSDPSKH